MGAESLLFCYVVWEWIAGVTMGGTFPCWNWVFLDHGCCTDSLTEFTCVTYR